MSLHWTLIHNPRSASGKGAKALPAITAKLRAAGIQFDVLSTEYPGHASLLTAGAIAKGARNFVAVGGDGTVNEVANGILGQAAVPHMEFLLTQVPIGTGNDWRRTVGIPTKLTACVEVLKAPHVILQDVGIVEWKSGGEDSQRFFLNIAGIGFEAYVGVTANQQKSEGKGGIMGYVTALLSCLRTYKPQTASFTLDGSTHQPRTVFSGAIGICKYNGGGMKQCPEAIIDDGMLDFTLIGEISKGNVLLNVPRLFTGSFVRNPAVTQYRVKAIDIQGPEQLLLEVDGENIGHVPARISVVPRSLRIAVPRPV